jgi:hypothetical protein
MWRVGMEFKSFSLIKLFWDNHKILSKQSWWNLHTENDFTLPLNSGNTVETYEKLKDLIQEYLRRRDLSADDLSKGITVSMILHLFTIQMPTLFL